MQMNSTILFRNGLFTMKPFLALCPSGIGDHSAAFNVVCYMANCIAGNF